MLKSRNSYASENAYQAALFRELCTVRSYTLSPGLRVQVKFLIENEKTAETGHASRFFIISEKDRSKAYYREDAITLLKFISVIRNRDVDSYQSCGLVYEVIKRPKYISRVIKYTLSKDSGHVLTNEHIGLLEINDDPTYSETFWDQGLDRFKEILQTFIDVCDGKSTNTTEWFRQGRFLMLPLHNSHSGPFKVHSLRLNWTSNKKINNLAFQCRDKSILFYALNKENTSSLKEITEGFIDSLYRLIDTFKNHNPVHVDSFVHSVPVILSEDRKHFMEYVGGRGVSGEDGPNSYKTMIVNVNSDAAPAWSKTYFHYNHDFVCDLIDGIRFLTDYKVE